MNFSSPNFSLIKKTALFANLDERELQEVLKNTQISNRKKGEILFFVEEKVLNFYVVLEGAVKIFIADEDGVETVLQIIGAGKFINDVFGDSFQASAQALTDCTILVIQARQIREFLKKNLNLAENLLIETAEKNAELLSQLTQIKLTNSKQKVGQFLLGRAFEKNSSKSKNIELQCEKSVVASYLGINPETLSRNLQKLKNDGEIAVEKNKITLLKDHSLCSYCDSKIATKCDQRGAGFCVQKYW